MRAFSGTRLVALPFGIALLVSLRSVANETPAGQEPAAPPPSPPSPTPAPSPSDAEHIRQLELRLSSLEDRERAHAKTPPAPATTGVQLGANWRDAFFLESSDGAFRLRVGGLVQADGRYFPDNTSTSIFSSFLLRSVRPEIEGTIWDLVDFKLTSDFGQGKLQIQDAYTEIRFLREIRLRGGKFKVPFGLERLIPEGRTAFLERAFPTQISPNRDIGAMVAGEIADGTLVYGVGVFNGVVDNSTLDLETDDDKEVAGRIFLHPFRKTSLTALHQLGVGVAASYGEVRGSVTTPGLDTYQTDGLNVFFRYSAGTTADDTTLAAGARIRAAADGCLYVWRIGLLGEYAWNSQMIRRAAVRTAVPVQAWQGYITFLLTDDRASYAGVKPRRRFNLVAGRRGAGAFELGFRVSGISVDDIALAASASDTSANFVDTNKTAHSARSYTVGLNWYLNANAKVQINYVRTDFSGGAPMGGNRSSEDVLQGRLQLGL